MPHDSADDDIILLLLLFVAAMALAGTAWKHQESIGATVEDAIPVLL